MAFKIKVKLTGLEDALGRLRAVAKAPRKKILKKAMDEASKPILAAAKAKVPRRTGLLRKSLGRRVKVYRSGTVVVVIGPRHGFRRELARKGKKLKAVKIGKGDGEVIDPVHYAHLVEFGTSKAAAQPFLRPAWSSQIGTAREVARAVIEQGIAEAAASGKLA